MTYPYDCRSRYPSSLPSCCTWNFGFFIVVLGSLYGGFYVAFAVPLTEAPAERLGRLD